MKKEPMLDLHGYRVDDVPDAVDRFLRKSLSQGHKRAKIMPGKGEGKVKKAVADYLKLGGYPFSEEKMDNGKINAGVLIVFIDD